jgi:hypothetical protein
MLVTESLGLNKIKPDIRDLLVVNIFWSIISLLAILLSLPFGTQYLYGGLLAIAGLMVNGLITAFFTKNISRSSSWMMFLIKIGIFATVFVTPVYTINVAEWGYNIDAFLGPINSWSTIIIFTIVPMISTITLQPYQNKIKPKIVEK